MFAVVFIVFYRLSATHSSYGGVIFNGVSLMSRRRWRRDWSYGIGYQRWRHGALVGSRLCDGMLEEDTVADSVGFC
jgi:hypothetical protein